ncbi:7SK snRNA methylphosphate capping enzyme [Anabrus simplex]|uniref:7SK snRNA methylphosphate capping enzyme n=1 Tax=Anabrus simplex TaxID=316456 RepID=UPI0035A28A80
MSTTDVERPIKIPSGKTDSDDVSKEPERASQRRPTITSGALPTNNKKNKNENDSRSKFSRKRLQSFPAGTGKFFPPHKRRKKEGIIPPTKFLLGGNIYDPLNLNSLQDEEINRAMNAVTPKSSPLPTPKHRKGEIEVIIPPNINDPLNLIDCDDDVKYEQQLVSPIKKGRKSRHKKKKRNSSSGGSTKDDALDFHSVEDLVNALADEDKDEADKDVVEEAPAIINPVSSESMVAKEIVSIPEATPKEKEKKPRKSLEDVFKELRQDKRVRKSDVKDKIVSPVIPQPGSWKRQPHGYSSVPVGRYNRYRSGSSRPQKPQETPKFQAKNARFQYGNYIRYYGYRNPLHELDLRLKCFADRKEIFQDKDVLDIGCNIGHVTLTVARDFDAKSVIGLDIDRYLIDIARKNVRHYVNFSDSPPSESGCPTRFFPISMPILYGDVDIRGFNFGESPSVRKKFPYNVTFLQGNYVLEADSLLTTEQPQFDVILCLSVTKWIHLNWGDAGLKRAFKRMFAQLRAGGKLILEVQAWDSYKRKRKLTETIFKNYSNIKFLPHTFTQYLLSSEVGFSKCEVIGTPYHQSRGFQRPIQMFTKGGLSSSRSAPSATNTPSYCIPANKEIRQGPVYTAVLGSIRETEDDSASTPDRIEPEVSGKVEIRNDNTDVVVDVQESPNSASEIRNNDVYSTTGSSSSACADGGERGDLSPGTSNISSVAMGERRTEAGDLSSSPSSSLTSVNLDVRKGGDDCSVEVDSSR